MLVALDGERELFIKVTDVTVFSAEVFSADPRLLIICVRAEYLAVDVAATHAPCEPRLGNAGERACNATWWSGSRQRLASRP